MVKKSSKEKRRVMTNQDAIKYLQQLYPNGGHCWLDEQRIEAIGMAIQALQEEPVSEDLEEASKEYATNLIGYDEENNQAITELNDIEYYAFKAGAKWDRKHILSKIDVNAMLADYQAEVGINNYVQIYSKGIEAVLKKIKEL